MKWQLKTTDLFRDADEQVLSALPGEYRLYKTGDFLFREGEESQFFFIILSGTVEVFEWRAGQKVIRRYLEAGMTTGHLQLLTNTVHAASEATVTEVEVFRMSKPGFWRLMADKETIREKVLAEMQAGLPGLLPAGSTPLPGWTTPPGVYEDFLRHFDDTLLNESRPASWWNKPKEYLSRLISGKKNDPSFRLLPPRKRPLPPSGPVPLPDPIQRINAEIQLTQWLEQHQVANAFDLSAVFVGAGLGKRQLEEMIVDWDPHALNQYLDLLSLEIELKRLAETLRKDKEQVAHLIAAIDAYTYWGPSRRRKEFQLHDSLGKALTLVDYKIRQKDIKFYRKFAARFPVVMGFENELMLAWTGILDHAVNSSYPGGAITIITYDDIAFNMVIVEIIDHGTGVPKDVQRSSGASAAWPL